MRMTGNSTGLMVMLRLTRQGATEKHARIIMGAMRQFAEEGYESMRIEELAAELGIAKGSIFQHFGSKANLFLEAYKQAVSLLPSYLDAPPEVLRFGFFEILRYWLSRTEHLVREDWVPYRVTLLGNYGIGIQLRREINRFMVQEDPYGTLELVRLGITRGEVRTDIDPDLIASVLDWTMERFQDTLLTEELDPRLFRRHDMAPDRVAAKIDDFVAMLRGAVGQPSTQSSRSPTHFDSVQGTVD